MSMIRHEIRQISDENRGQPIISQAVVHGNVAYFAGITPNPIVGDIKTQTAQVLRRVDELLNLAGTDKSRTKRRKSSSVPSSGWPIQQYHCSLCAGLFPQRERLWWSRTASLAGLLLFPASALWPPVGFG